MKQREIWVADLNPVKGKEQKGRRPIVVISGNAMNDNLDVLIVCPLTSVVKNFKGCLVLKPDQKNNLEKTSEVLTFQIRTITTRCHQKRIR